MNLVSTLTDCLAAEIRAEAGRQRVSGRELARRIDRPVATVSRWLRGDTPLAIEDLERLTAALDLDMVEILRSAQALQSKLSRTSVLAPAEGLEPSTCRLTAHSGRSARIRRQLFILAHGVLGVEAVKGDLGYSVRDGGRPLGQFDLVPVRRSA